MKTKIEIEKILRELLQDKADFVFLFGSWAKGEAAVRSESDGDCAAFFHPAIVEDLSYFDVAEQFGFLVGRKLDLICLNTADIIIASQVVANGEVLFAKSKQQLLAYQADVMSRYLDFKQSRKIIEDNILIRPNYGR